MKSTTTLDDGASNGLPFKHWDRPRYEESYLDGTEVQSIAVEYPNTGRSRRLAVESHAVELKQITDENGTTGAAQEVRKTIGDVATAFIAARSYVGLVVLQTAVASHD